MRKLLSLILALCLVLTVLPVVAETATEEKAQETTETTEEKEGLETLLGLFGGMAEIAESENSGAVVLSLLAGALSSEEKTEESAEGADTGKQLLEQALAAIGISGKTEDTHVAVAAENADAFYGNWKLIRIAFLGAQLNLDTLKKLLEKDVDMVMTLTAEGLEMKVSDEEPTKTAFESSEFADGGLKVKIDGDEVELNLNDAGELCLCCNHGQEDELDLIFAKAE